MPPDTIPPSGNSSFGEIQAKGPTKLVCPNRILDVAYLRCSDGSNVQNLMVLSLDEVATPAFPHTHIPRTYDDRRNNDDDDDNDNWIKYS